MTAVLVIAGIIFTLIVAAYAAVELRCPSFTLKLNVAYDVPLASVAGVNTKLERFVLSTSWFGVTFALPKVSTPALGNVVITIECKVSPTSMSVKLKSPDVNVLAVFLFIIKVALRDVGASLTFATVIWKFWVASRPSASLSVRLTSTVPTSAFVGVPVSFVSWTIFRIWLLTVSAT